MRLFVRLLGTALVLATSLPGMPVGATGPAPAACRVRNIDTGVTKARLQRAVDAATAGDRLTVRGTCGGVTIIGKDLVITGTRTATSGPPTLDGGGMGTVLTVRMGTSVSLATLTIRNGARDRGGGIRNRGTLSLTDVTVRDNTAHYGAGAWNTGTLILRAASSIRDNVADPLDPDFPNQSGYGGGVHNTGTLVVRGVSSVRRNQARYGAGVYNTGRLALRAAGSIAGNHASIHGGGVQNGEDATLLMKDSTTITGNEAQDGGGVMNIAATLTMQDSSTIRGNQAELGGLAGGGLFDLFGTLTGVRCPWWSAHPDPNVYENTPGDCYISGQ